MPTVQSAMSQTELVCAVPAATPTKDQTDMQPKFGYVEKSKLFFFSTKLTIARQNNRIAY